MQKSLMLVLAGVAIGLLVAPQKGAATERKISNWLSGKAEDANEFLDDAVDSARSKAREVKNDFTNMKEDAEDELTGKKKSWS